ncbi:actin-related protein 5-like [Sycon ciliatum]|uniref:actin-related protein 5-like n=1 Tax=Sycon ciliatum TaxID=27933 RepID=UPI0031F5FAD6
MEEIGENLYSFTDSPLTEDKFSDDYDQYLGTSTALIIDNGAYQCRAGWSRDDSPRLVFRNLVAKGRNRKEMEAMVVGNDIGNLESMRWALRSPFDRNLVTHYDTQELVFDHICSRLGISSDGAVGHPVVLTEPVCNPPYCRSLMSELLFECYSVPSVLYGVDSLFSLYHNLPDAARSDALVVACGHQATHILPVVDGHLDACHCKRINVGGAHCVGYMQRLLQLGYPVHLQSLTLSRAQELVHRHCRFAINYSDELSLWKETCTNRPSYLYIQMPFTPPPMEKPTDPGHEEREKQRKLKQGQRLQEINAKRRQEKLDALREEVDHFISILDMQEKDPDAFQDTIESLAFQSADDVQLAIDRGKQSMKSLEDQIARLSQPSVESSKRKSSKTSAEAKSKRICEEVLPGVLDDPVRFSDPGTWIRGLHSKRQTIMESREKRRKKRSELSKRHSHASHQRMRIIAELAREKASTDSRGKPKEDTFGMNDDDWHVYREISKGDGESDSERDEMRLCELENLLLEHDPTYIPTDGPEVASAAPAPTAVSYRIAVGTELVRVPEILFQPSLVGVDQAGLVDTMEFVLKSYSDEQQQKMVQNVFLTGGVSKYPNLKERVDRELLAMRPYQSSFGVTLGGDPHLDAWHGAKKFAVEEADFASLSLSRADYYERGGEYLRQHLASNVFVSR